MRTVVKNSRLALIYCFVIAGFIATNCIGAEQPLRWKFKVGEKLNFNMTQQMWMSATNLTGRKAQVSQITWNQYIGDCGPAAQKENETRSKQAFNEKYKGKTIEWTGRVNSMTARPGGKGYDIVVNMDPTEADASWANVLLTTGDTLKTQATALKTGNTVRFIGKLVKQGSATSKHEVETTELPPDQSLNLMMHQVLEMTWDVEGVDEATGEAVIQLKFNRVKMKMTRPAGTFEYDSQSDAAPTGFAAKITPWYKALTGGEIELTVTSRGEIKDVKIPEQVLSELKNSPSSVNLGDLATPDGFKKIISQGALVLPKDPPKKGDTWSTKLEMNNQLIGKQIVESTYRYDGTKDVDGTKYALIHPGLKMDIETPAAPAAPAGQPQQPAHMQGLKMKMKDQNSDGEVLFNSKEGRLHSAALKENVTIEANADGQPMDLRINQKIDVQVSLAGK